MHSHTPDHVLQVSYYGFNDRDRRLLYTLAAMSALSIRKHGYTLREAATATADIFLVDAGAPPAVIDTWLDAYKQQPLSPTLLASAQSLQNTNFYRVNYPLTVTELIQSLDHIARREFPHIGALYRPQAA